jgi:hypothetical protein
MPNPPSISLGRSVQGSAEKHHSVGNWCAASSSGSGADPGAVPGDVRRVP